MNVRFIIFLGVIFMIHFGCKEDICASETHTFNISEQTKEWIPNDILTQELKFQSESGQIMQFQKEIVSHNEYDWSFSNPCGDGNKRETILYERIHHNYNSGDTVTISMSTNIVTTECGWGNVKEVKLMEEVIASIHKWRHNPFESVSIGTVSIRTKLINADETEDFCKKHYAKLNPIVEINGVNYQEVYSDDRPGHANTEFPLAEIYYQKGQGVIGFIDEYGMQWKKVE